jgi:predicted Zn-dependent peptidase
LAREAKGGIDSFGLPLELPRPCAVLDADRRDDFASRLTTAYFASYLQLTGRYGSRRACRVEAALKRAGSLLLAAVVLILILGALPAAAQDIASFEKRITVKKLANGLTVILCRRPEAPVLSFYTIVDAGSVQDPRGATGLAHMFEHMAFKGTDKIGTKNYTAEKLALAQVEKAYAAYNYERHRPGGADPKRIAELENAWQDAVKAAGRYVVQGQFDEIVEGNGGVNLNASTSWDSTQYFYSFPANRLELWAYLESQRFLHPVLREFYKEREVVIEERRMRTDSSPMGRLFEQFVAAAFMAHPYHQPTIGWLSDLNAFSATDAQKFFDRYYVPSNMVIAIVGDITPERALPVIERYFNALPTRPKPEEITTVEPPQNAERRVVLTERAQPLYLEAYHRPSYRDPDDPVYDAISDILSNGRVSRLYRSLVRDKKIAAGAAGFTGFPGYKYPHLFAFYAIPTRGHTPQELAEAFRAEIERLKSEDVTDEELQMFRTRAKADLIRGLGSNEGLAQQLAIMQLNYGDWRELFRQIERYDHVTKQDIRRVANQTFVPANRTVGIIESAPPPARPAAAAAGGAQ